MIIPVNEAHRVLSDLPVWVQFGLRFQEYWIWTFIAQEMCKIKEDVMKMYLMLVDTEVLYFNLEDCVVEVIRNDLLPFSLRSNIRKSANIKDILHNIQSVKDYLSIITESERMFLSTITSLGKASL